MPRTKLPKGSVPVTFRLPRDLRQLLLDKARREEISFSEWIRRALRREITATPPRPRKNSENDHRSGRETT